MSETISKVRDVSDQFQGTATLVQRESDGAFFVVSSTTVLGTPETLVFPADSDGAVTDWGEVAGGKFMSQDEAIDDLAAGGFAW